MSITPLTLPKGNVAAFVDRAYRDGHPLQFLRELFQNGLEAGATRIIVRPVESRVGDARYAVLSVQDNGPGMSASELRNYFSGLGESHNDNVGDPHANFGVGAKISTIPWNKAGVVIVSRTEDSDVASMIWICFDEDSQSYGLRRWVTDDDGLHDVIEAYDGIDDPDPDDLICVNWLGTVRYKTGTSVILLGDGQSHTAFPRDILNSESGQDFKNYLCRRYYQLPEKGKFSIYLPPKKESDIFPLTGKSGGGSWSWLTVVGSNTYLEAAPKSGLVLCPDGASVSWFIDDAENTIKRLQAMGYRRSIIAIRYQDELFHYRNDLHARFGIFDKSVARKIHLIIESPDLIPDQTRSRLKPINGGEVNFSPWANHFAENMPAEIVALLDDATPDSSSFPDEYAERLASELGSRFRKSATAVRRSVEVVEVVEEGRPPKQRRKRSPSTPSPRKERNGFDLPKSGWESAGVHAPPAVVSRPCVPLPAGMVTLNEDHPLFVSVFEEWAAKYDEVYKGRIIAICKSVFQTDFVSKVAHAGSLPWQSGWSRDDVYDRLLDESSMTVIALGLIAHDSMIQTMIKSELKGVKPK